MENNQINVVYESSPERDLIKMWEDIKGNNIEGINRNLMKAIAKNEEETECQVISEEDPLYTKRMWDSERGGWVPFSLWGAYSIVNDRKEIVVVQMWRPADIQPEYGPTLKGWHSLDSSYLNEKLKETADSNDKFDKIKSFSGVQSFKEIVRQDQQELYDEGRYNEMNGYRPYRRV